MKNDKKTLPQFLPARRDRPLCKVHRLHWNAVLKAPASFNFALNNRGVATRSSFLLDIKKFMDVLVSEMNFVTCNVGIETELGFLLRTWKDIAKKMKVDEWRVKQCAKFAFDRNWITSVQPRDTDEDGNVQSLASVKKVTEQYFSDLNLEKAMSEARASATEKIAKKAEAWGFPVRFLLMPISMIRKIAFSVSGMRGTPGVRSILRSAWFELLRNKIIY